MSDQISNDHFFMSEDLEGRLDPGTLIRPAKAAHTDTNAENCLVDEVSVTFTEEQGVFLYPLASWNRDSITIEVPVGHLGKFFDPSTHEFNVKLFDNTLVGLRTIAEKKDGSWFVTVFHFG